MSSKRATNRHRDKPVNTANIRQPATASGVVDTDIPQETYPDGVRLSSRARARRNAASPSGRAAHDQAVAGVRAAAAAHDISLEPDVPAVVTRKNVPPGDISRITRNDVELFFDAAHAFRTNLANVLPDIATRLGRFILAEPYTIVNAAGHPIQLVPDASAMTPAQAKLAGLVLHRMLPPITDMDIEGRPGLGKGGVIDARQVKITVNTITTLDNDPTDRRLRDGAKGHPNAARQIAPITMNLSDVVERAQSTVGAIDGIDPQIITDTLPGEPTREPADPDGPAAPDPDEPHPLAPSAADRD